MSYFVCIFCRFNFFYFLFFNRFLSFIWPLHFVRTHLGWNCHFSHIEKMTGNIYSLFTKWIFLNFCKLLFVIAVQLKCLIPTRSFNSSFNLMLIRALFCRAELITLFIPSLLLQLHFSSGRTLSSSRRLHSFSVIYCVRSHFILAREGLEFILITPWYRCVYRVVVVILCELISAHILMPLIWSIRLLF